MNTTPPFSTSAPSLCTTRRAPSVLNNLEFDHADIFPDLAAIETQFHHLVRTVPGNGLIVSNGADADTRPGAGARLLDAGGAFWRRWRVAGGRG